VRQPQGPVALRIAEVGEQNVLTSIVVACELRYGAAKRASRKLTRQVDAVLGAIMILPFESGADRQYAAIRTALEKKGTPIGAHDNANRGARPRHRCHLRHRQRGWFQTSPGSSGGELARRACSEQSVNDFPPNT